MDGAGGRAGPGAAAGHRPFGARGFLLGYYLATPLFVVLDLILGINLRTTFLDEGPGLKFLYYGLAFCCGLAISRWPARAGLIGLLESGINIGWLVVGVALRYLDALEALASDTMPRPISTPEILNLMLSALVLAVSYLAVQARLARE